MKKRIALLLIFIISKSITYAQLDRIPLEPDGGNKRAWVAEQIGLVKIAITYNRPGVKGREGKIYNTPIAHYGFVDLGHGTSYSVPWRAGANENTTITFSHPVKIEGKDLVAGTYGFFIALGQSESTLVFSKNSTSWGSFYYEPEADALRVTVKNQVLPKSEEWLSYEFVNQTDSTATITMSWEKLMIPFTVEVDKKKIQMDAFRAYFKSTRSHTDLVTAANYCLQNNVELPQALEWMDRAINLRIMGVKNFQTISTKAAVLFRMNRAQEAKKVMEEALPMASMLDMHGYARTLLRSNEIQEAVKIYKTNYAKYPTEFVTLAGMGRAHSALGEYKKAAEFLRMALPKSPDNYNRNALEVMLKKLDAGQDANL
ncbi:DUF2911 domain-containing protein [Spirosoma sp. BT702]|uniref:DUF2911 domain-containing protein n=1 Tax=Spirosoma profusum TaxID=2771354 RepID=A0A926XYF4_9BACT|nr:DUF2911 domain-containing protein [Spirosoma profusum]MBD2702436.1 DUF2911 domain-containing protein [Spirosoma profusum]